MLISLAIRRHAHRLVRQRGTVRDMSFDLFDMSKITTIGGNRYCSVFIDNGRYATAVVHVTKNEIPEIFDRVLSQTPACHKPTIVKSDNAREYHTQQLREVLKKHNVEEQLHSNEAYERDLVTNQNV